MSKTEWGNATWLLFHSLAEKLNEEYIKQNILELKKIIYLICSNLPCPYCAEDAIRLLNNAKIENIKTKNDFQIFIWSFHNKVNTKLKKNNVPLEYLTIYKKVIIQNVIKHFNNIFFKRTYNEKLLVSNFNLIKIKDYIINFFNNLIKNNNFS